VDKLIGREGDIIKLLIDPGELEFFADLCYYPSAVIKAIIADITYNGIPGKLIVETGRCWEFEAREVSLKYKI